MLRLTEGLKFLFLLASGFHLSFSLISSNKNSERKKFFLKETDLFTQNQIRNAKLCMYYINFQFHSGNVAIDGGILVSFGLRISSKLWSFSWISCNILDFIREMLRLTEGLKFWFLLASGFHPRFEAFLWFLAIRIRKFCHQLIVFDLQSLFRPLKHWMIFHRVWLIFRIVYSLFPQNIY